MGFFAKLSRYVDDLLLLPEEARDLAEQARALLDAGDPAAALEKSTQALAIRADHPQLLALYAEALSRLGEFVEAERMYREAIAIDGEHGPSRFGLARLLHRAGRIADAADELRRAVPILAGAGERDEAIYALVELSQCHLELQRPDRAARELRKAVSLDSADAGLHARLASILAALPSERGSARAAARRAVELVGASNNGALIRQVGQAALAAGLEVEATEMLRRAEALGEKVHLDLGRALAAQGQAMEAHEHALRAMEDQPGSAEPHRLRAELALRTGDRHGALAAFEAAVSLEPEDLTTLRRAVETAAIVDVQRAGALAANLLKRSSDDPLALAVRVRVEITAGRAGEAERNILKEVLKIQPELPDAWLGLAEYDLQRGRGQDALEALERVESVAPDRPELERLGIQACRLVASSDSGVEPDLFDVLERVHSLFAQRPELSELAIEIGRIREDYDKPLLLTVMGEFNAGKSTFINALVGEPVAPMGITPTTATINVLKYGPERKVRVLHRSGTVKELEYEDLGRWLKGLSREAALEVRLVEILYPAEELMRVNLVDTPGFNSIVPEHELVARQFIEYADAVVWLFDAGQAGKESEREALARVTARGKGLKVLGVLNKADRLTEEAMAKVVEHLAGDELSELIEETMPLSARSALLAKQGEPVDETELEKSGLPALQNRLESLFYSRARLIKRVGCAQRLVAVLERGMAQEMAANAELRRGVAALAEAQAGLTELSERLVRAAISVVEDELKKIKVSVAMEAAKEVLEFVRPRRHLLDSHHFGSEDREFLLGLIDERLYTAMTGLSARLVSTATAEIEALWQKVDLDGTKSANLQLQVASDGHDFGALVTRSLLAFHRGLMWGGRADAFFSDDLPRIELEEGGLSVRIERWWKGSEERAQSEIEHGAAELVRRLTARILEETSRLRLELARRRRVGSRPLVGFASLARDWTEG